MGNSDGRFTRYVRLHGFVASIDHPPEVASALDIVLAAYPPCEEPESVDLHVVIRHDDHDTEVWRVSYGERNQPERSPELAASRAEWIVITHALRSWSRYIHVHAALVGNGNSSALLIGRSGSGKSTTSVALAARGWDLYTDDVALIGRDDFAAWCCPRPIKLDDGSRDILNPLGVSVDPERTVAESVDRTSLPGLPPVEMPGPRVKCAFFFAGQREDVARLRPIPKSESALLLMLQSSTDFDEVAGLTAEAYSLIASVACYELIPGELTDTAALVVRTIDEIG